MSSTIGNSNSRMCRSLQVRSNRRIADSALRASFSCAAIAPPVPSRLRAPQLAAVRSVRPPTTADATTTLPFPTAPAASRDNGVIVGVGNGSETSDARRSLQALAVACRRGNREHLVAGGRGSPLADSELACLSASESWGLVPRTLRHLPSERFHRTVSRSPRPHRTAAQ